MFVIPVTSRGRILCKGEDHVPIAFIAVVIMVTMDSCRQGVGTKEYGKLYVQL